MSNFKNKIVYEVYLKSFFDKKGDGKGDIQGLIEKLDYLKSLGVTTLWITPFYKSPMIDEGYDISDYYKVNKDFGTMEDIDELIKKTKEKGLEIMLDFVLNHTSDKHPWFQKALKGDKKYQEYYFFFDKPQNEWEGRFGGGVWEYVPSLDKYYLHLYEKNQPDLNWDNPIVRDEMLKVVDFWLSKGVSSCKFDVLYLISKPTANWEPKGIIPSALACRDGKYVHKYIREMSKKISEKFPNVYTVGEMSFSKEIECVKYSLPENKEVDMVMTGKIAHNLPSGSSDKITRTDIGNNKTYIEYLKKWYKLMNDNNGWLTSFTENHDSSRTINRFGDVNFRDKSAMANILNVTFLRGTPFFLQGQEIGMLNPNYNNIEDYKDIKSINAIKEHENNIDKNVLKELIDRNGRDPGRNTMSWDLSKNAGFSVSNIPWRKPNNGNISGYTVKEQEKKNDSILNFFKNVIKIRKDIDALNFGDIKFIDSDDYVLAYTRSFENKNYIILINLSSQDKKIDIDFKIKGFIISNYNFNDFNVNKLRPWESILIETF